MIIMGWVVQYVVGVLIVFVARGVLAAPIFVEVSEAAGVVVTHGYVDPISSLLVQIEAGGAAGGDFDGDGWADLYVVGADLGGQRLFRNNRDGSFVEVAVDQPEGVARERLCGPAFADIDGDNDLDLFVGTVEQSGPVLLMNRGTAGFVEVSRGKRMFQQGPFFSASFGDYDRDGDLDLLTTHWSGIRSFGTVDHLWDNDGSGMFRGATEESGLSFLTAPIEEGSFFWTFTGNFVDIDNDGWLDILMASDFGFSQIFRNTSDGNFVEQARDVLTDENAMGVAIGDYDNDGDLDWFVSSIADIDAPVPNEDWNKSGNRLYRNDGLGNFDDATEEAGVRDGSWGWGACFADMDNDGDLDLFHVNGWDILETDVYKGHPARFFLNQGDGTFAEMAAAAGIDDRGEGRGVVCFDYDRDGDIDVFISNNAGPSRLYRNETAELGHFLQVKLVGRRPNTEAIGARITVVAGASTQIRELRSGNNYVSQSPAVAHFGLGSVGEIDQLHIRWPLGAESVIQGVVADRRLVVFEDAGDANCDGTSSAADLISVARVIADGPSLAPCPGRDLNYDDRIDVLDLAIPLSRLFDMADVRP